MDGRVYSVNIWAYVTIVQKGQGHKILNLGPQIFMENLAKGLGFTREGCWSYVSIIVNILEKLISKFIFLLKVTATLLIDSRKGAVGA